MPDSPKQGPRSPYARPGEIDTALVERESLRSSAVAKPNSSRSAPAVRPNIPELKPAAKLNVDREPQALAPAHAAKSMPSPQRPVPPINLTRGLAPPPGIVSVASVPLRPVAVHPPIFERKQAPSPPPFSELKPVRRNPQPSAISTSPPRRMERNVSARLELLPDAKPQWKKVGLSAAGQLVILGLALLSPMIFPQTMKTAIKFDVIELLQPVTEIPPPIKPKPRTPQPPAKQPPKPKVEIKPPEIKQEAPEFAALAPQLSPRQPHIFANFKPVVPTARAVQERPLDVKQTMNQAEIVLSSNGPAAPKEDVKPNPAAGNPGPAAVNAALSKVQTGGFGDPNGIAGPENPNRRGNINRAGSPGLNAGPGYGNGTGGARGLRGAGASGGSGGGVAGGAGGFSAGVTILHKPNPAYSAEGRDH